MYDMLIPQATKMLRNLNSIFGKAETYATAKKVDFEVLLQSRLAIDMLPLVRQVQIACDTVKLGASRLTAKEAPTHADDEKSLADVRARIQSTIGYLESLKKSDFDGASERKVTTPRWEGKWLTGTDYLHHHVLPNLYFHVTTAYAILRHNGVEIGKKDYLGELPYQK